MSKRLYVAYGSNLNISQMSYRCPTAKLYGTGVIEDYALQFKGSPESAFATIAPKNGSSVPVAVWEIQPKDEKSLDRYEGYPSHYFKKDVAVQLDSGEEVNAMVYIMNLKMDFGMPSVHYYRTVHNGRATGVSQCQSRRVREDMVYDAFMSMADKFADNRQYLIGTLIEQIELLRSKTSKSQERIREIDKELADLGARNLVIARLHTSGVLNATDYATQTAEIGNKITELRIERRKKLSEDEDDELLDELRSLDEIISEYISTSTFNEELFGQIVESIMVDDSTKITFKLMGGIELTEEITERGRCKTS